MGLSETVLLFQLHGQLKVPTAPQMPTQLKLDSHGHMPSPKNHGQLMLHHKLQLQFTQPVSNTAQTDQRDKLSETVSPFQSPGQPRALTAPQMLIQLKPVSHGHMLS